MRNQSAHVKLNLVHKVYRLQRIGRQPIEYFYDLCTENEIKEAEKKQKSDKRWTWYTLTQDSLINIFYQVFSNFKVLWHSNFKN